MNDKKKEESRGGRSSSYLSSANSKYQNFELYAVFLFRRTKQHAHFKMDFSRIINSYWKEQLAAKQTRKRRYCSWLDILLWRSRGEFIPRSISSSPESVHFQQLQQPRLPLSRFPPRDALPGRRGLPGKFAISIITKKSPFPSIISHNFETTQTNWNFV